MKTRDLGSAFLHLARFAGDELPLVARIPSQEIDPPFRRSNSILFRVPFTSYGIVVGWWQKSGFGEEEALMTALSAYGLDLYNDDLSDPEVRMRVRERIAEHVDDPDDEWVVMSMILGDD